MHIDNQTSPITFASDVKISAKITSEKYTGILDGLERHLRIALRKARGVKVNNVLA